MVEGGIMDDTDIVRRRLHHQLLAKPETVRPDEVVRWFGAIQAQEYLGALWAVGVRVSGAVEADIERSVEEGRIVRTWPMRGTIHFVPAEDARWMLDLLTPRVVSRMAGRHRQLGLDGSDFDRSEGIIHEALRGGKAMARRDLMALLDREGVSTAGQRGYHVLWHLAQRRLLCFGPREGKQPTFVLLEEWAPKQRVLDRGEAFAELAGRYFRSHGPATIHDFAWWAGLTMADAKEAVESVEERFERAEIGGKTYFFEESASVPDIESPTVHLLPPFDEYTVAYRDRGAVLDPAYAKDTDHGLTNTIVLDGRVVGAWKRRLGKGKVSITPTLLEPIGGAGKDALAEAAHRYGAFLGKAFEFTQ
jgi:hypothetical protein